MADYELALVTADDLPEKDKKELLESIEKKVTEAKGKMGEATEWSKKTLAFPINKKTVANFTFVEFSADAKVPAEIRRQINLSENVLRSLLIKKETPRVKKERARKTRTSKED